MKTLICALFAFTCMPPSYAQVKEVDFIPFEDIQPELNLPNIQVPTIEGLVSPAKTPVKFLGDINDIKANVANISFTITGEYTSNDGKVDIYEIGLRTNFQVFEKNLKWLKTNSFDAYSPFHYPVGLVRLKIKLLMEDIDDLKSDIQEFEAMRINGSSTLTNNLRNSAYAQMHIKLHKIESTFNKIQNEFQKAKDMRAQLEPFYRT